MCRRGRRGAGGRPAAPARGYFRGMWWGPPRGRRSKDGGVALAEAPVDELPGSDQELIDEIERLTEGNRIAPSIEQERMLLRPRNLLAIGMLDGEPADQGFAEPDYESLPPGGPLPELDAGALTPALLRAGILR